VSEAKTAAILGDGGWGTAMALLLAGQGRPVRLWGYDPAYLREMQRTRENPRFLPGYRLPPEVAFEPDMTRALTQASLVIVAIPTKFLRASLQAAPRAVPEGVPVVSLTKGIEPGTLKRPSEILRDCTGCHAVAVLSGPSHAELVAAGQPTTVVVAARDESVAQAVQDALMTPVFRVYRSTDMLGVELGGALKNVIALAAGICTGLGLGDNALAALITRGLAEIARLGVALGARPETFAGLSGMGDLVVTCISAYGRNRAVGLALAEGKSLAEIEAARLTVAEGVTTAGSALALARSAGVEMPIVEQVVAVLAGEKDPRAAVTELMTREGKAE